GPWGLQRRSVVLSGVVVGLSGVSVVLNDTTVTGTLTGLSGILLEGLGLGLVIGPGVGVAWVGGRGRLIRATAAGLVEGNVVLGRDLDIGGVAGTGIGLVQALGLDGLGGSRRGCLGVGHGRRPVLLRLWFALDRRQQH